jgi:MFS family permease
VTALLLATAVLLMGNGLLGVLVPIRADLQQFSRLEIGALGSGHFFGLMVGCLLAPRIIAQAGHIRAFTAFTATATITPLLHAMWPDPVVWTVLRALNGICFAGLFMGIESWLTEASSHESRGRVLAAYTIVNLTVVTIGMQMIGLAEPTGFELFSLVAILYSLAAVPVALTRTTAPSPPRTARLRLGWLFAISPAAVLSCMFAGLANSAFWTLITLYGAAAHFRIEETATLLGTAVLAGAASQWPAGLVSDKLGRRVTLIAVAIGAAAAGIGLFAFVEMGKPAVFALAAIYGACAFPIYPLAVAHANDLVPRERAVEVSSGLLLTFSAAAVLGPLAAALAISQISAAALFLHTAMAHALIAVVLLVRSTIRPTLPTEDRDAFVALPRTTPAVFELDPRAEPTSTDAAGATSDSPPAGEPRSR